MRQQEKSRITLANSIYETIYRRIVDGSYEENSRLPTEHQLAEEFNVSRAVVREALMRLKIDQVIMARKGAGSFVQNRPYKPILEFAPPGSIADIQRCFEFRFAVEGEAAYLAAERHTPESLNAIEEAVSIIDTVIAENHIGAEEDIQFHRAVAQATENHFFIEVIESATRAILFGMNLAQSLSVEEPRERLFVVQREHKAILDAIRQSDPAAAREAMHSHIRTARRRVFEGPQ